MAIAEFEVASVQRRYHVSDHRGYWIGDTELRSLLNYTCLHASSSSHILLQIAGSSCFS